MKKGRWVLVATFISLQLLTVTPVFAQQDALNGTSGQGATAVSGGKSIFLPECLRSADTAQTAGIDCVRESITYYTGLLLFAIAIGAFFYLLYGGFLYVSAFGDEAKTKTAKKAIQYALVGVIIAGLSGLIISWLSSILQVKP